MTTDGSTRRLRVAVTTGPVDVPPTYFVLNHLLHMGSVDGRVFSIASRVRDPEVAHLVESATRPGRSGALASLETLTAAVWRQGRAVRRFRPDLVHQHFATWSVGGAVAARDLGVPFVATLHGYDVFRRGERVRDVWSWITARNVRTTERAAVRLLAVSEWLAGEAVRLGFPADKVSVHYQGVDTDFFTPATEPRDDGAPRVLYVGALERRKGVMDAVRASVELARTQPHVLEIVGAGSQEPEVQAAQREHRHLVLRGPLDRAGVRDAMRRASVFVMPTQREGSWREAAGLVTLEAQACGTPVVVYASGGAPEMLQDGVTGTLLAERDVAGMARAVADLLTMSPQERSRTRRAARDFVVSSRSVRASAAELEQMYRTLVP